MVDITESNDDELDNDPDDNVVTKKEKLQVIWEEYKLRQVHYWSSFNRFSLAIITINVVPYINPSIAKPLGGLVAIFPIIGLFISAFCTWLLAAEYERLKFVKGEYDKLLGFKNIPAKDQASNPEKMGLIKNQDKTTGEIKQTNNLDAREIQPIFERTSNGGRIVRARIGKYVCISFGVGFIMLSGTNIALLLLIKLNH